MNPLLLPIPDYVLNSEVRDEFVPTSKALFYEFSDGYIEPLVLGNGATLRPQDLKLKNEFSKWLDLHGLEIPEAFREDNDDVRFLIAHQQDFQ